jgi:hypothetical protein
MIQPYRVSGLLKMLILVPHISRTSCWQNKKPDYELQMCDDELYHDYISVEAE